MDKKRLLKCLGVLLLCCVMTYAYVSSRGLEGKRPAEQYRILADGFTIPGLIVTGFGIMMVISDTGTLDGVIYGMQTAFRMLTFQLLSKSRLLNYAEFREHRREMRELRRQNGGGFWYIVMIGGAFLVIAMVFTMLYLRETGAV